MDTLYIKNMVCVRCIMAVQAVLEEARIAYSTIELGWAVINDSLSLVQRKAVECKLKKYGLELLQDRAEILVERIKTEIIRVLHLPHPLQLKLSVHLSRELGYNYTYLANTFSEQQGLTLERYFIMQRVEMVKELIVYEDLSLNEIADRLAYSSVSHLCLQFKKVTALTPAQFRKMSRGGNFVWREIK